MGSYLSAPMLVFRLGVLARACETPCGATDPPGPSQAPFGAPLFPPSFVPPRRSLPFPPLAETDISFFFFFSFYFVAVLSAVAPVSLSLPLYARDARLSSLFPYSIFSLAYLKADTRRYRRRLIRIWKRVWEILRARAPLSVPGIK